MPLQLFHRTLQQIRRRHEFCNRYSKCHQERRQRRPGAADRRRGYASQSDRASGRHAKSNSTAGHRRSVPFTALDRHRGADGSRHRTRHGSVAFPAGSRVVSLGATCRGRKDPVRLSTPRDDKHGLRGAHRVERPRFGRDARPCFRTARRRTESNSNGSHGQETLRD